MTLEKDERVGIIDGFSYGSVYWQEFNGKAHFDLAWTDALYKQQLQKGLPELWFFRQIFLAANPEQRDILRLYYTTYHDWFFFELAAQFDSATILSIDSLTRDRITLDKPILWSMRNIYTYFLKTDEQRELFKTYDPVFYRWLEFERSISPLTPIQTSKIDALGFKLEQDGNYKDFVHGLKTEGVLTDQQWEAYKKAYPEIFAKPVVQKKARKPQVQKVQSSNDFLKFFCSSPDDEAAHAVNNGRKKRSLNEEDVLDKGPVELAEPAVVKHLRRSSDPKAKIFRVPGLLLNNSVIEWKPLSDTTVHCTFNSRYERDQVYQDISDRVKLMEYRLPNGFLTKNNNETLSVNKDWIERLYGNFILVETLQQHSKELTPHLILLFTSAASEDDKTAHTWTLMQFLSMDAEQKNRILCDEAHKDFSIMLNKYSYHFNKALCSQGRSLTNLITHFTHFTDYEKEFFETHIDLVIQDCNGGIKDSIREFLNNILMLAQTALLEDQSFPAMLYVRYLEASEPEYKMLYLLGLDAKCISREYLLKGIESAIERNGYK